MLLGPAVEVVFFGNAAKVMGIVLLRREAESGHDLSGTSGEGLRPLALVPLVFGEGGPAFCRLRLAHAGGGGRLCRSALLMHGGGRCRFGSLARLGLAAELGKHGDTKRFCLGTRSSSGTW